MKIANGVDAKINICDAETFIELFDVGFYNPDTKEWVEFQISKFKNELYEFVKYYTSSPCDFLVTYNGIDFDQPVFEFIVRHHQEWFDKTNLEITKIISDYASKLIRDNNFGKKSADDDSFHIYPLDVFKINHFDNKNRRVSLKWCAYMMNMDVEEMPYDFRKKDLTEEEISDIISYRRNDIIVTLGVLYLTLGQFDMIKELNGGTDLDELSDYKGINKIQDRIDVQRETGLKCLNWSDVKIGEEWNKKDYLSTLNDASPYEIMPKNVVGMYGRKFSDFYPSNIEYATKELGEFVRQLGAKKVRIKKQEFPITIGKTTYIIAKGGLHSKDPKRHISVTDDLIMRDADVQSQYPNSVIKHRIHPPHIDGIIIDQLVQKVEKRIEFKNKFKELESEGKKEESTPYKSVQNMLKDCLNGGYYGKLNQSGSFLEYPEGQLKVAMANQLEILMLIEMMTQAGFNVISGNTDGILTIFPRHKEDLYNKICAEWEKKVGNVTMGKLEFTDFEEIWQEGINSYIAKKKDGTCKKKGRFATEFLMHKNKKARIIPLAMEEFFVNKKDPVQFIKNHKNIFDFCIAVRTFGGMYFEEEYKEGGNIVTIRRKQLVRYFISKEGSILWKRGINHEGQEINNHCNAPTEAGQPLITYFNKYYKSEDYNIDYDYYILNTLQRIDDILKTKMYDKYLKSINAMTQLYLF